MEEIHNGRYCLPSSQPAIISALGAIPKSGSKVRLIHDCSRGSETAPGLNDYFSHTAMKFQSAEDLLRCLKPGWYMCKIDLAHAYRSVGIHPRC